jgi:hypothetical protein
MDPRKLTLIPALLAASLAQAQAAPEPTAIVEEISVAIDGVRPMAYLADGTVIDLPDGARLVVDYLGSCVRETITGGRVTIGTEKSRVANGQVTLTRLDCGKVELALNADQREQSGVSVTRKAPGSDTLPSASVVVEGLTPLFTVASGRKLCVERLDAHEREICLPVPAHAAEVPGVVDFAKASRQLAAGGLYRAKSDQGCIVFQVDIKVKDGSVPLIERLVRL